MASTAGERLFWRTGAVDFRMFFDKPAVLRAVAAGERKAMAGMGALIRKIVQRSMRYVSKKNRRGTMPAGPGEPPHAIQPHPWLRRHLYFGWDAATKSMVVGPKALGRAVVPRLHERGGKVFGKNPRRRRRVMGGSGEIRVVRFMADDPGGAEIVADLDSVFYARLKTPRQVARANRLNEQLYGPEKIMMTYEPRPYMGPALLAAKPSLARFWQGAVKAG